MTKDELLHILADMGACDAARAYVSEHPSMDAGEIWRTCDRPDWLCRFLLDFCDARARDAEFLGGAVAAHLEALGWPDPTCPWPECPAEVLADLHGRWEHIERVWTRLSDGRQTGVYPHEIYARLASIRTRLRIARRVCGASSLVLPGQHFDAVFRSLRLDA